MGTEQIRPRSQAMRMKELSPFARSCLP